MFKKLVIPLMLSLALAAPLPAWAGAGAPLDSQAILNELKILRAKLADMDKLKARLAQLEAKLAATKTQTAATAKAAAATAKKVDKTAAKVAKATRFKIGGSLRFNYRLSDYNNPQKSRGGDGLFDIFRIDVNGAYNGLIISAQYRWYSYMHVLHHGWIGYNFSKTIQGQLGVTNVPFGLQPYFSHNYWFSLGYYIGLEDDYDLGAKIIYKSGPVNFQVAFFKNEEYGSASDLERYSVDVVQASGSNQLNQEANQINARFAYTLTHAKGFSTEFGLSGMWGQLYNSGTDSMGSRYAVAGHVNANYGRFNIQLLAAKYMFDPDNPAGVSNDTVTMGAFAASFPVAAEGTLYVANIAYKLPVKWGPVTALTFYNDFSMLSKEPSDFESSYLNTIGMMISANPVYVYIDFIMGKNALWVGAPSNALAAGDPDADWRYMFNINVGYYF